MLHNQPVEYWKFAFQLCRNVKVMNIVLNPWIKVYTRQLSIHLIVHLLLQEMHFTEQRALVRLVVVYRVGGSQSLELIPCGLLLFLVYFLTVCRYIHCTVSRLALCSSSFLWVNIQVHTFAFVMRSEVQLLFLTTVCFSLLLLLQKIISNNNE